MKTRLTKFGAILVSAAFAATLTSAASKAQNLVNDPYLKTPSAWQTINSLTQIVSWGPVQIETRVTDRNDANKFVGIRQTVRVPRDGYYQLMMHADTRQRGQTGGIEFRCELTSGASVVLRASGYANEGPDTRMNVAFLKSGAHELSITGRTVYDSASFYYRLVGQACFLEPVELPCANWHLVSSLPRFNQQILVRGVFSASADSAIYLFSTKRLDRGIAIPGIGGQLWLDPASASGVIVTNLLPKSTPFSIYPWPTAWPQVHVQILELKTTGTLTMRLGSSTYSSF